MLRLFALLMALGLLAAWLTRPHEALAETELRAVILDALATEDIKGKDAATSLALMGCRLDPGACYDLVRSALDTHYDDRIVYAVVTVSGFSRRARCYGIFATFVCPGGFARQ
ncbi:hypothetical protein [Puniceibacterium confluentis]|uniref:hypothetical protein n=1 Tax=Puniceibacterium confluentis TaxID=1958944 RepID=UPI0011B3F780|nr:hypothetical protein [Puniceibacterium confluentis]